MKKKYWIIALLLLPIVIMVLVNSFSPEPSFALDPEQCTRYCHSSGCPHFKADQQSEAISPVLVEVYWANIRWLKQNGLGLSYQEMNILVYVILFPLLVIAALWGLIRKRATT